MIIPKEKGMRGSQMSEEICTALNKRPVWMGDKSRQSYLPRLLDFRSPWDTIPGDLATQESAGVGFSDEDLRVKLVQEKSHW